MENHRSTIFASTSAGLRHSMQTERNGIVCNVTNTFRTLSVPTSLRCFGIAKARCNFLSLFFGQPFSFSTWLVRLRVDIVRNHDSVRAQNVLFAIIERKCVFAQFFLSGLSMWVVGSKHVGFDGTFIIPELYTSESRIDCLRARFVYERKWWCWWRVDDDGIEYMVGGMSNTSRWCPRFRNETCRIVGIVYLLCRETFYLNQALVHLFVRVFYWPCTFIFCYN